jgi:hypothetical protein
MLGAGPTQPTRVEVELENSSYIEGRGVRHTHWDVQVNDAWVPIDELRGIPQVEADPELWLAPDVDQRRVIPPGCQYRITYVPRLPLGTKVRKRVSKPRDDARHDSSAATLKAALGGASLPRKLPLAVKITEYRVTGVNALEPLPELEGKPPKKR